MPDLSSMPLTFDDEFNTRSISLTGSGTTWADSRNEWRTANGDVGFGSATFVDPTAGYDPFNVSNGVLTITAVPNKTVPTSAAPWESGLITTQNTFTQTYGYFEMRADLASTVGAWDAFWLLPVTNHPSGGRWQELDIVEHYGDDDKAIYSTIHTTDPAPNQNWQRDLQVVSTEANPSGYHTYGLMWTADTLSFYVDGTLIGSKPTPSDMHSPMYILANLATSSSGTNNANPSGPPIQMKIDYIRAYALPGTTQAPPVITSGGGGASATISTPENRLAVTTVTATDPGSHALTFALSGGADVGLFAINPATGALTFKTAQDFETPADANHDGIYDVTVSVSDGTLAATHALHVALSNVVEAQTRTLTSGADQFVAPSADNWTIHAGAGNDVVTTGGGNDLLDSGSGADTLTGGAGNDIYWVDNSADKVIEAVGGGTDVVFATATYTLPAGQEIENLRAMDPASTSPINLTGNEFNNYILGNAGANTLSGGSGDDLIDGGGGIDTLIGGAGNDRFVVDNAADKVIEAVGGGNDAVVTSVSYTLGAGQEIEMLRTIATGAINLTGNEFANTIIGNAAANIIDGGAGADRLAGGGGADTFNFTTALGGTNVDTITDFTVGQDLIGLSRAIFKTVGADGTLASNAFYTGTATHAATDRILYNSASGDLFYDADGNGPGAAVPFAHVGAHLALTNASFHIFG